MRPLLRTVLTGVALAAASGASPAWATANTYVFSTNYNVTSTPNASSQTSVGGAMGFSGACTACTGTVPAITASITAWNANPATQNAATPSGTSYAMTQATLGMWQGGLGVLSSYDAYGTCGAGNCGMHQIDGVGNAAGSKSFDFVQITFSKAVTLSAVSRVAYGQVMGNTTVYDDDFSFGHGTTAAAMANTKNATSGALDASANNTTKTGAAFTSMLTGAVNTAGACTVLSIGVCYDQSSTMNGVTADQWHASTVWWISASLLNPDNVSDAFKLYDFSVVYNDAPVTVASVPEPASWTTMIGGFGLIGGALRRRKAVERLAAA